MKFEVEKSAGYKRDFEKLPHSERANLTRRLDRLVQSFKRDRSAFLAHAYRPVRPKLSGNFTSTVWVLRVTPKIRVLFAYDEDPLFETLKLILLRIFNHDLKNGDFLKAAADFHRSDGLEIVN